MTDHDREDLRQVVLLRLSTLDDATHATSANRATVELDQQSVGRLSRMDALQGQAMAQAQEGRRRQEAVALTRLLARIDDDEFGYCEDCGDAIALPRLRINPIVTQCIECARG